MKQNDALIAGVAACIIAYDRDAYKIPAFVLNQSDAPRFPTPGKRRKANKRRGKK